MEKNILWLASWYPNKLTPFDGDFIQRHARAVSLFTKLTVIHIKKDEKAVITKDVKVVSTSAGNLTEIIVFYHSADFKLGLIGKLLSQLKYTRVYKKILADYILKNGRPDIVHVHVAFKAGLQALYLKKNLKLPFIVTEHWTGYYKTAVLNFYNSSVFFQRYTKKILSQAALLLPVTHNLGETINANIATVPFTVVENVADTNSFYFKPIQNKRFRFIHVSSLNYQKNPEAIIRSARRLADLGFDFELMMIGWVTKELADLAARLLLLEKYVVFRHPIPYEEVASEMQQSSCLLMFSRVENLPCVIIEALCCGLPIVSSDVGGISEVVNESNGILVKSEDETQLLNAMKKIVLQYNKYDRAKISQVASAKFSYEAIGKKIYGIYSGKSVH
ncbi:MAG: glycosyltransferase [Ginsengibacter sp.]